MKRTDKKIKKIIKITLLVIFCLAAVCVSGIFIVNHHVKSSVESNIVTQDEALNIKDADCILVLGAMVYSNNTPSAILNDRIKVGTELYKSGVAPKILMSGDHGRENYDEVFVMKKTAVEMGIESKDVFNDHAGFSTYESMYRAKEVFGAKKIIIVTQKYHMYRALYIAKELGLEAYGVCSDLQFYENERYRNFRELLARNKDFVKCIFKPLPKYLGEPISLESDGNIT